MKLRKIVVPIATVLGGAAFALSAHAQPRDDMSTQKYPTEKFRSLDANGDGFLSRSEASQIRDFGPAFDKADANRDGKLSLEEFAEADAIWGRTVAFKYIDDSALTAKVKAALLEEPGLKSTDVGVETYKGRVLLSGWVEDDNQRKAALRVASKVHGVQVVKDGMAVK